MILLINNSPEDKRMFLTECDAYDENRWRNMALSVRNRTMTRQTYKELRHSLRKCSYSIKNLSSREVLV